MQHPLRKKSSMNNVPCDFSFTVMLLGDSCTGKTCVLVRFKDGTFLNNNFISTVGIDYRNKIIPVDGKQVKLQIFDTAGQERFRSVTSAYYRDADALLLVYDIANRLSFENIRNWLGQIKDFAKDNVMVTLIGNKCDLAAQRKVTVKEAQELAATPHAAVYGQVHRPSTDGSHRSRDHREDVGPDLLLLIHLIPSLHSSIKHNSTLGQHLSKLYHHSIVYVQPVCLDSDQIHCLIRCARFS
ncbi:hypothetical protein PENTCL1PPCAC_28037 [Pristionchus entomophagus]|uniref:ADP ribosylation factor n=1 Tax=Pristionchus entomophagus TaxID=358040 RepID=A0AAV5UHT0_9BILA|nr:hypothetical protein PENTCL1PPCAC_28037 [Pristionchus entomophagus]